MSDKTKFEHQLNFFAKASLWYYLPSTVGVTVLLGVLTFPNPLKFPIISLMFVIMLIVDVFVVKALIAKKRTKQ